jgi:hypothetical protein
MDIDNQGAPEGVTEDTAAAALDATETDETLAQGDEQSGDDAAAADDQGGGEQPKPKKSPQERINEVTKARREAERERDYWRDLATQSRPAPQPQAQQPQDDGEPDPSAYEHGELDARFIRDHATYHARKAFREEQANLTRQTRVQTAIQTFEQRAEDLFPDGEPEGLERFRSLPTVAPAIQEVIMDSEIGPKLADYLGSHTRELNRISALTPLQQARELTKLELKLASPPAPTPKTATDAPAPTPQVRGAGGRFTVAPDTDDFAAFEKQYGKA